MRVPRPVEGLTPRKAEGEPQGVDEMRPERRRTDATIASTANDEGLRRLRFAGLRVARATGLEPATTGSTVRYSNQLSYAPSRGAGNLSEVRG